MAHALPKYEVTVTLSRTGMRLGHVKDLWICHGSATDLLWTTTLPQGQVCGLKDCTKDWSSDCFFVLQTLSMSVRSRSGNVIGDICWYGSVKDDRDAARTSRMGLRTIRALTNEIRKSYGC